MLVKMNQKNQSEPGRAQTGNLAGSEQAWDASEKLPLTFITNAGQTHEEVRYYTRGACYGFYFTPEKVVFTFLETPSPSDRFEDTASNYMSDDHLPEANQTVRGVSLALGFLGANPGARLEGQCQGTGNVNYFIGNDPDKWYSNLPTYGEVVYRELWPGVNLVFRGVKGQLKYDFILQPGAKVEDIGLSYDGAESLSLNETGNLLINNALGILTEERPVSYQDIEGQRVPVESRFVLKQQNNDISVYGFEIVGTYDPSHPLVIDPGLDYSTYLGGSSGDLGQGIAVDDLGNAYVTGFTASTGISPFPTTAGAFDTSLNGGADAFVTKLSADGSSLVYSTYLGGSGFDQGQGIAVDASGNAYVTGRTNSTGASPFPTTTGAFDTSFNSGSFDAFVTKLSADGSSLVYSTYLGGSGTDRGFDIDVDALGNAYVTGVTNSSGASPFPTTAGAFGTSFNGGSSDAFVTKLSADGSSLVYSTYLGGIGDDGGLGIAVDALGNAYVAGSTSSGGVSPFPITAGAFDTSFNGGLFDAFVTKLSDDGSSLVYSTYLGGSGIDIGFGIAVDVSGNAYVTGQTDSTGISPFPTTTGAFDTSFNGGVLDAFVTKLSADGSSLIYSTYLGGGGDDQGRGITVDTSCNAYVTGLTASNGATPFPTTAGAFDTSYNGGGDAFVTKLSADGSSLVYSTYLGGSGGDQGFSIAVDASGNAYVTGLTSSTGVSPFPTTAGAFDTSFNGGFDAFITKLPTILPVFRGIPF